MDLLNHAVYHLARAKQCDEEKLELERKKNLQIQELKEKKLKKKRENELFIEQTKQAHIEKRTEFAKKMQNRNNNSQLQENVMIKVPVLKKVIPQQFHLLIGYFE